MDKIKILHTADLHLNAPIYGIDASLAAKRKEEIKNVFSNIVDMADENEVDALIIAGDLFDSPVVPIQTAVFVKKCFERIKHIPVYISAGNHDHKSKNSIYAEFDFGENVYIFDDKLDFFELRGKRARIWGYSFPSQTVINSCLKGFSCPQDDMINILALHADVALNSIYNPITPEMIENAGFDYIALGHIHSYDGICYRANSAYAYSGMPEGVYFDEPGEKGVILGEVGKGYTKLDFVKTSKRCNETLEVDVSGCDTYEEIADRIKNVIENKENLYKVVLKGTLDESVYFDMKILKEKLLECAFFIKLVDETEKGTNPGEAYGPLGKTFEELLICKDIDSNVLKKALEYGKTALSGKEINRI